MLAKVHHYGGWLLRRLFVAVVGAVLLLPCLWITWFLLSKFCISVFQTQGVPPWLPLVSLPIGAGVFLLVARRFRFIPWAERVVGDHP